MKVWVVEIIEYGHSEVNGVFSEEERAWNYVRAQMNDHKYEVYEVEVDYLCK